MGVEHRIIMEEHSSVEEALEFVKKLCRRGEVLATVITQMTDEEEGTEWVESETTLSV